MKPKEILDSAQDKMGVTIEVGDLVFIGSKAQNNCNIEFGTVEEISQSTWANDSIKIEIKVRSRRSNSLNKRDPWEVISAQCYKDAHPEYFI